MTIFIVRTKANVLVEVDTVDAQNACLIARVHGHQPKTAWQKEFCEYAQPRYLKRVTRGDIVRID